MPTAYRAARVFDGTELLTALSGMAVVVSDGRIDAVCGAAVIDPDCAVVDLGDVTILPGLIDAHVHLAWDGSPDPIERVRREPHELTILRAANHAAAHLRAGVTAVRDLGAPHGLAITVARVIDLGIVPGPRVLAAGRAIAMTGGHVHSIAREADGPDAVRRAVREELKAGARCIKIMASGGVMDSAHSELGAPQLTESELRAAVDEAHRAGRAVAAHAHSLESIHNVINANVQSVEHGTGLDATTARRMSRERIRLVPTLSAVDSVFGQARAGTLHPDRGRRIETLAEHSGSAFRIALHHQVPVVAGSDAGVPGQRHGALPTELAAMVRAGATPRQAVRAATVDAAELLGIDADHSSIEPGKRADLLAVAGDPLADIRALQDVRLVVLAGQVAAAAPDRRRADLASAVREFMRSWHAVARNVADRVDHPDYPLCQQRVLLEVGSRPGTAMAELRAALDIDAGQLSRAVHDLEASGAVEVRQGVADRRRRTVTVTEVGLLGYQRLDDAYDKAIGDLLGQLSDTEQTSLVTAMDTVRGLIGTALRRR